jgi:hypothetical protein
MVRRSTVLALLVVLGGCGEAKLNISLERPSTPELDPLQDPRLAKFSLRVVQSGETTDQDAFRSNELSLLVGQVPTGVSFDLRLAGKSATDDMLGLGLVLDVGPLDGESEVRVKFRKPIGFVAGGKALQVLNTAGESASIELAPVSVGDAGAMAATPTGAWLLALVGQALVPVKTIDHTVMTPAQLDAPGRCIAVSPDSRTALICHDSGISAVPLDLIGGGNVRGQSLSLKTAGRPTQIAFANRRQAWVLLDGLAQSSCTGAPTSSLVQLDLTTGQELSSIPLDRPIGDLAVATGGTVLFSLPCEPGSAHFGWLEGSTVRVGPSTPGAQDVAPTERGIVAIGTADKPVRVQAQIFDLDKGGLSAVPQSRDYQLPPLVVQFTSAASSSGLFAWISEPKDLRIGDVTVAPDGRRAIALFSAHYVSDMTFGNTCKFEAAVGAEGYVLLDLASGAMLLERYTQLDFTSCAANCLVGMDNPTDCAGQIRELMKAAGLLLEDEFKPTSATLLFGAN